MTTADTLTVASLFVAAALTLSGLAALLDVRARYRPHPGDATFHTEPGPTEVDALEIAVADVVWVECSGRCAHLESPHELTYEELLTCLWCGTTRAASHG